MSPPFVTEKELANTYYDGEGWTAVTQYRTATTLRADHPDMARAEIARRVGRPPSAVRGWLSEGKQPRPVSGLETARTHGWLHLEPATETFRAMSNLVAWIFSGGGISQDTFTPTFSVDDTVALATIDQLLSWLDVPYTVREYDGPERAHDVVPGSDGVVLGRVLHVLGAPTGRKAQHATALPDYLAATSRRIRRDFARVYVFNRLFRDDEPGMNYIAESRPAEYTAALHAFLSAVTTGPITYGSQDRLWISADALAALCPTAPMRPGLATHIAHGAPLPPTRRAFKASYRRRRRPGGVRYARAYRAATESSASPDAIADTYDLPVATVRSWSRGSTPRVITALSTAQDAGWVGPHADVETLRALGALAAWGVATGTLRGAWFYPVFRATTSTQRAWFRTVADRLGVTYSLRLADDERPSEFHLTDGSIIGRLLYTLGVPPTTTSAGPLPTPALFAYPAVGRAYLVTWCLHYARRTEDRLAVEAPGSAGDWILPLLADLSEQQLEWTLERRTDDQFVARYASARPDFLAELGPELTTQFESDGGDQ